MVLYLSLVEVKNKACNIHALVVAIGAISKADSEA